jgi:hypothetical protein
VVGTVCAGLPERSETECINALIAADIEAVSRRYQRLKVTEPTQRFAGHDRLSALSPKATNSRFVSTPVWKNSEHFFVGPKSI